MSSVDVAVIGKLMIDEHTNSAKQTVRETLGGGALQAAFGARAVGSTVGLCAPVGEDFATNIMARTTLQDLSIDTEGVKPLPGYITPRLNIRYEAESMVWEVSNSMLSLFKQVLT